MNSQKLSYRTLDEALKPTLQAIEQGKQHVFEITESARNEYVSMEKDLAAIQTQVFETIQEVESLEADFRRSRHQLVTVSRNFTEHSEDQIKTIYDEAQSFQTKLLVARNRETQLRSRREELTVRLRNLKKMIEKAEMVVTQLGAVFHYLSGDLQDLEDTWKTSEHRQYLGIRVIQAQEEERRRLAREIHDGPAQMMANVAIRADICERILDRDLDRVRVELRELKSMVRQSLSEVRQIIFDLRPMELDDLGLIPTLRRYISKVADNHKINIEFIVSGNRELARNSTIEVALFRSIQEALNNIVKHSFAKKASVVVHIEPTKITVTIHDNGQGFDREELISNPKKENFGLFGIEERLHLLNGTVDISSQLGEGTLVVLRLPIPEGGSSHGS